MMAVTFSTGQRVRHVRTGQHGTVVEQLSHCWVDWRPDVFDGPPDGACRTDPSNLEPAEPVMKPIRHEEELDLRSLAGKTVQHVGRYLYGWRMRFTDGTVICVNEGQTFDRAGNFVREPGCL